MPYPKDKYKGKNHWNYGRIAWNLGILQTKEAKEKNRIGHLGKRHTEKWKKLMSQKMQKRKNIWGDKISKGKKGKRTSVKSEFKSREKHWNWRGGISQERQLVPNRKKERIWAKKVKERDNWICQECGSRTTIMAHHKKFWTPNSKENYKLRNGITLCRKCHYWLHWELLKKRANSGKLLRDNPELNGRNA